MIKKTDSYFQACKAVYNTVLQDLLDKGLNKNNIPKDYPFSRRTIYNLRRELMGTHDGFIAIETFSKAADFFGITLHISFVFSKKGSSNVYPLLEAVSSETIS